MASSTDVSCTVTISSTSSRTIACVSGAGHRHGDALGDRRRRRLGGRRRWWRPAIDAQRSLWAPTIVMSGRSAPGDHGHPGQQPAAAGRDHQRVELGVVVEQLERHRALAGDHGGVVVGVHERAALGGQPLGLGGGLGQVGAVQHDAGAEHLGALHLHERRVRGHHDGGLDAEPGRVAGDGLGVVAGRHGDDTAAPLVLARA